MNCLHNPLLHRSEMVLKAALGARNVMRVPPINWLSSMKACPRCSSSSASTDPKQVPESMKPGAKPLSFNHSPFFAPVPESSIKTGVRAMGLAVLNAPGKS
ncbi:MAG TPA: hypothetical protein VFP68_01765 [Burkholderiaceae bacterium]|nr:hypothetical protein [Burkholderiaceae bacterium]